jgi:hypothetical protein
VVKLCEADFTPTAMVANKNEANTIHSACQALPPLRAKLIELLS